MSDNEKFAIRVWPDFGKRIGVGRVKAYQIANRSDFYPAFRLDSCLMINVELLKKWLNEQCQKVS